MMVQSPMVQDQQMPMRITSSNVEEIVDVTVDREVPTGNVRLNTGVVASKEMQELAVSAGTAQSIGTVLTRSQEQKEQVPKS